MTALMGSLMTLLLLCSTASGFVPPLSFSSTSSFMKSTTTTTTTGLYSISFDPNNNHHHHYDSDILAESEYAGNLGFDPLHLAQTKEQLFTYRQAEMKHARLAMFAILMWMGQEFQVINHLGATPFFENRAFPEFVGAAVGLPSALELYGVKKAQDNDTAHGYFPGNLGMDPFHLYPAEQDGQRRMQFAEVMMGRLCMLAAAMIMIQGRLAFLGFEQVQQVAQDVVVS